MIVGVGQLPALASRLRNGRMWRVVTSSATASRQSRTPPAISRSELPVVALAEPLADAALLASHFSPPSVPLHGATRISTLHEIWVWRLTLLNSIFLTVDATMNARAWLVASSVWVGRPPGQVVA